MTNSFHKRQEQIRRGIVPEGYKKTQWGIIPVQWDVRAIGDIATVSSGSTPKRSEARYWNGHIPWVTTGELVAEHVSSSRESISDAALAETNLKIYPAGTLLIAMYGQGKTRGTTALLDIAAAINQACAAITLKEGLEKYLFYVLQASYDSIRKLSNVGNQENLNADIIRRYPVVWAPRTEQRKIAKILATQDKIIDLWNRKIEQLRLLRKLCLRKMFPRAGRDGPEVRFPDFTGAWRRRELGDIAQFSKGVGYSKSDLRESGTPIILYGRLYTKYELEIADVDTFAMAKPEAVYSRGGEVIIPASGETAEDIAIASVVGNPGILIGGDINILFPSSEIDATFMAMSLSGGPAHNEVAKRAQGKSVVHLHNADLEKVMLSYPSLKEQKRISAFFRLVEHLIALHQRRLAAEEEKKKALMQLLLTGIVRV
ncbi:MAG: restriction endonuclease subunit S [Kiritimatiellae bacterium]|nr:restriction endonuclease subunit S [Kiritimatiellia bacterium]